MTGMSRTVALAAIAVSLLVAAPATAKPHRTKACAGERGEQILKVESGRIVLTKDDVGDDIYASPYTYRFCRGKKEVRAMESSDGSTTIALTASTHRYMALALTYHSSACEKYNQGGPNDECYSYVLYSFDMRTGRRRAFAQSQAAPRSLVLVPEGWVAWADGAGVSARINGETRVLDAGPGVDPASLAAAGATVTWTRADGTPGSAQLG